MASKLLSIAFLVLFAFSAVASVAASGEAPEARSPGSGSDDSFSAPERKFEFEISGQEVKAKAGFYDKDLRVRRGIKIEAKADEEGLRFYARFYNREGDSKSMYSTKFRVRELFEYISATNNATGYAVGDQVPNRISRWTWAAFQSQSAAATSTYARQLSVKTQDGAFEAILKFNIPENGSIALTANDIKIDFNFDNSVLKSKGWLSNPSARLGLKGTVQTGNTLVHKQEQRNSEVEGVSVVAGANSAVSSVEWTNYVMCGGRRVSVVASRLVAETATRESEDDDDGSSRCNAVYWSILDSEASTPSGKCIWDPTVKIMGSATQSVASFGLLILSALALIFFM